VYQVLQLNNVQIATYINVLPRFSQSCLVKLAYFVSPLWTLITITAVFQFFPTIYLPVACSGFCSKLTVVFTTSPAQIRHTSSYLSSRASLHASRSQIIYAHHHRSQSRPQITNEWRAARKADIQFICGKGYVVLWRHHSTVPFDWNVWYAWSSNYHHQMVGTSQYRTGLRTK
jgi:hypothetical protein